MTITKSKPYKKIKSLLKKSDKIWLISCNSCARVCKTGGEQGAKILAEKLKKDGFQVCGISIVAMPCVLELMAREKIKADVIILLSCVSGVFNAKKVFKGKKIVNALKTIGLGVRDNKDNFSLVKAFK